MSESPPTVRVVEWVVTPSSEGGVHLLDLAAGEEREVTWTDLPQVVAAIEASRAPRWVWPDTRLIHPRLLAGGVRVARCHDLRLSHAVLRWAADAEHAPPPDWLAAPTRDVDPHAQPALLEIADAPDPTPEQVHAETARQLALLAEHPFGPRLRLLLAAESAGALIAEELRVDGLPWDLERHDAVLSAHLGPRPARGARPSRLEALAVEIRRHLGTPGLNPDSPVAVLAALQSAGLPVRSTSRWELRDHEHPVVAPLLEYKSLARLLAANGWEWQRSWVRPPTRADRRGRLRIDYVPAGVVTGRWATRGGGALQIPKIVRGAVLADPGHRLVVADAAQIEPRCLAAMAGDEALAAAGRAGDLYAGLVRDGVVATRDHAKVGMLGALYGGTTGDSGAVLPRLRRAYPRALGLVDQAARTGESGGDVHTWLGRTSPPPTEAWAEVRARASQEGATPTEQDRARSLARERGRFTRNFVVQGTAAEWALSWMAQIRLGLRDLLREDTATSDGGPAAHLAYFLHDEIVVHAPAPIADDVAALVRDAAAGAGRLLFGDFPVTFPLEVRVAEGYAPDTGASVTPA